MSGKWKNYETYKQGINVFNATSSNTRGVFKPSNTIFDKYEGDSYLFVKQLQVGSSVSAGKNSSKDISSEMITVAMFDGKYANHIQFYQFNALFDMKGLNMSVTTDAQSGATTYQSNFTSKTGTQFTFDTWSLKQKMSCTLDVSYTKISTKASNGNEA